MKRRTGANSHGSTLMENEVTKLIGGAGVQGQAGKHIYPHYGTAGVQKNRRAGVGPIGGGVGYNRQAWGVGVIHCNSAAAAFAPPILIAGSAIGLDGTAPGQVVGQDQNGTARTAADFVGGTGTAQPVGGDRAVQGQGLRHAQFNGPAAAAVYAPGSIARA